MSWLVATEGKGRKGKGRNGKGRKGMRMRMGSKAHGDAMSTTIQCRVDKETRLVPDDDQQHPS